MSKVKRGIDIPKEMWEIIKKYRVYHGLNTNTAYINQAILEKFRDDGILEEYRNMLNENSNEQG